MAWNETADGIDATFKIANTMAGEDALVEASDGLRDGFSVGVSVDAWANKKGVMEITAAKIMEISLVTDPAINSARVSGVAASENEAESITEPEMAQLPEGETLVSDTVSEAPAAQKRSKLLSQSQ